MVVYEFEMVERFLENSMYLDIPTKFLLLAQYHCLSMFALKIVLKNFQSIDVPKQTNIQLHTSLNFGIYEILYPYVTTIQDHKVILVFLIYDFFE